MLCPEVWNFDPPPFSVCTQRCGSEEEIFRTIRHQYFNHHVSLTFPNTIKLPNDLINIALEDSQYYRINEVPAAEFLKKEFVNLFINKGQLTAVSLNEFSEQESVAITPCGKLILSLSKSTFPKLGIEGTLKKHSKTLLKKYSITLDLLSDSNEFKKKCEQVQKKLATYCDVCFDVVLAWEPDDPSICPSSIAYYFSKKGYFVKTCDILYKHKLKYNVAVPTNDEECDIHDLMEWLGAFTLECDISGDSYLSSMKCPEKNEVFGQIIQITFTGLISHNRLKNIISEVNKYVKTNSPLTWIGLTVQGFQDQILNVAKKQLLLSEGDQHCTLFFRFNQPSLLYIFQDKKD